MNRVLKVALICGVATTMASCGAVSRNLPFGLGKKDDPGATASAGDRISVLEFEQQLTPSAALSGRSFAQDQQLSMSGWILERLSKVGRRGDDCIVHHDHRADGHIAHPPSGAREAQGLVHGAFVQRSYVHLGESASQRSRETPKGQ